MTRSLSFVSVMLWAAIAAANPLESLPTVVSDYSAARVSSYDRSGGNADALAGIQPGATAVLADIEGPGMITHSGAA